MKRKIVVMLATAVMVCGANAATNDVEYKRELEYFLANGPAGAALMGPVLMRENWCDKKNKTLTEFLNTTEQIAIDNMNPSTNVICRNTLFDNKSYFETNLNYKGFMFRACSDAINVLLSFGDASKPYTNTLVYIAMNSTYGSSVQHAYSWYVNIMQEDSLPFTRQLIDRIGWGTNGLGGYRFCLLRKLSEVAGVVDDSVKEEKRKNIRLFLLEALNREEEMGDLMEIDKYCASVIPYYDRSIQRETALTRFQANWPFQHFKDYGKAELELLKSMPASAKVDLLHPDTVVWNDGFDSLPSGTPLIGVNGWKGWDNQSTAGASSSGIQKHSGANSVAIAGNSDFVHTYTGCTSGTWVYTAWQFVPTDFSGTQYFILLNKYSDNGPYNWSLQVSFDSAQNKVVSDYDGANLPLVRGQWMELRVEINLNTDTQIFYYGGTKLFQKSWSAGIESGGARAIAAIDLFANGASPVYYDDIALIQRTAP